MRINVEDYFMGRDHDYPGECTDVIRANAATTVERVNSLIDALAEKGIEIENHPETRTPVASGWRPAAVNARVPGAAVRSKHMSAEACDLYDPDGLIDDYLMTSDGQALLTNLRLYLEDPGHTKNWSHVQTVAPRSGKRVFIP